MEFELKDPKFEQLINLDANLEIIGSGFEFTEGPVWHARQKCLYFSDIPANTLYRYSEVDGVTVFKKPSHFSNGLTLTKEGKIIACEHQRRAITLQTNGEFIILAYRYQGKRLNSPNDLIISPDGAIIFSDPIYGLREGLGGPAEQELHIQGVYMYKSGMDEPKLLVDDFERPNGLALSHDGKTLYVDDTVRQHIRKFIVNENWDLSGGEALAKLWGEGEGRPDGMKLDINGNIFCTGPGGIWVINPKGALLGKIHLPQKTANLAWGDDDRKSLYITSSSFLYRLRCKISGKSPMD
ncbi:MAG TPA: SMP-30/gluconolactonase/LRE family protein [Anaerolineae bacterium]|nr:SMP-30/gluconolactonase/LRE family protein [Anaerolineae bacterium]